MPVRYRYRHRTPALGTRQPQELPASRFLPPELKPGTGRRDTRMSAVYAYLDLFLYLLAEH